MTDEGQSIDHQYIPQPQWPNQFVAESLLGSGGQGKVYSGHEGEPISPTGEAMKLKHCPGAPAGSPEEKLQLPTSLGA